MNTTLEDGLRRLRDRRAERRRRQRRFDVAVLLAIIGAGGYAISGLVLLLLRYLPH